MADYSASTNWANESAYLNNLVSSGTPGQAAWAQNQLGLLNSAKAASAPISVDASIGNYVNALDTITGISDRTSARSLDYAKQHQDWSASQAAIANQYNAAEAAKNRDWQEYMSNTAHQREVADLKAAGLNPVLSAMGGNGANVGSGATASAVMPSGSAGQADTSANGALVSILGSMLAAQTSIANQAVSARTQEAVADKYTAMSYLTSEIAAQASRYAANQSAAASRYSADQSRAASKYSADQSRIASFFAANQARASAKDVSERSSAASIYGSDKSYDASKYSADSNFSGRLWQQGINEAGDLLEALIKLIPSGGNRIGY